jgi:hypothetical protein
MAKTKDVSDSLRYFVDLGYFKCLGVGHTVDEKGYVVEFLRKNGEDIQDYLYLPNKEDKRKVIIYQETLDDHESHVLVPFAEGLGKTPQNEWFYSTLRNSLVIRLIRFIDGIIRIAVEEKAKPKKEKDKNTDIPMELVNFASVIIEHADVKLHSEYELITRNQKEFFSLFYNNQQMKCIFRCALFDDPEWRNRDEFQSIRKRSWGLFEKLFLRLFKITEGDELKTALAKYTRKSDPDAAPKLSAQLSSLFAIYYDINDALVDMAKYDRKFLDFPIDLGTFKRHLDALPEYSRNAKFFIQPAIAREPERTIPGQVIIPQPIHSPYAAIQPSASSGSPPPGMIAIPGPIMSNGIIGPPVYVPAGNLPQTSLAPVGPYGGVPQFTLTPPQMPQQYYPGYQPPNHGYQYQPQMNTAYSGFTNPFMTPPTNLGYVGPGGIPSGRLFG